uniref:trafficking protein particle complex subunit 6A isoform X4 n=1 Tax=Halichoerus grypus TaxID=9711 RepID=UPI001659FD37|nr:trafficking protein particle complex subunit 6A isoform X4 [Halichoerus grypus]
MADATLFEFLHTEMVAELWAHHSDPGPGAGARGPCPPHCLSHLSSSPHALSHQLCPRTPEARADRGTRGLASASQQEAVSSPGTEDEPVCPGGHGLPCGPGPGREPHSIGRAQAAATAPQAAPGDTGLQRGAGHPQVPVQRPVGGRVPEADGQPPHQSPGDLRPAGQQLPSPHPDGLGPAVSGGSTQVPGLHLRPPARCPLHPGHQEPGHRLRGIPAHL